MTGFAFIWQLNKKPLGSHDLNGLNHELGLPGVSRHGKNIFLVGNSSSHENGLVLGFDGRLDNLPELREELCLPYSTNYKDALSAAYLCWGDRCPEYLQGDYAFVLWDPGKNRIFAARDAMGMRPLYYHHDQGTLFAISTSARALTKIPGMDADLEDMALLMFAMGEYDERLTPYTKVKGLDWGSTLSVDPYSFRCWRWWNTETIEPLLLTTDEDYQEAFIEVFDKCVSDRCQTDAHVIGSTLSGGMDSTSVTATATRVASGKRIIPYSFRFNKLKSCDESYLSNVVAQHLGLTPHFLDCENHWLFKGILLDGKKRELPFFSWETLDLEMLAHLAEQGGKVMLTGHGGDGLMTGCSLKPMLGEKLRKGDIRVLSQLKARGLPAWRALLRFMILPRIPLFLRQLRQKPHDTISWVDSRAPLSRLRRLFAAPESPFKEIDRQAAYKMIVINGSGIRRACQYLNYLGQPMGIEYRHPFFDRRLAELMLSIPPHLLSQDKPKSLLRHAMSSRLPQELVSNVNKPFLTSYYHYGILKEKNRIEELMHGSLLAKRGIVKIEELTKEFKAYLQSDPESSFGFFVTVLMVENWLRNETIGE